MGAGNDPKTRKGQERGPRQRGTGHHGKRHDPHQGRAYHDRATSAAPPPPNAVRLPGVHPPTRTAKASNGRRTDHTSAYPPATRRPHEGWRAHLHGENRAHPQRKPHGTPPRGAPPRPHRQAKTPAATRATSQAPEEDEGMATASRAMDRDPQRTRDQGTGPQGGQPHGRLPAPPARAARPGPHSTDPPRHQHLTAPPSHQPATLRSALRTTTQARLTPTDPPQHKARPRHTAPQRAAVQRATARRDATRHRAAQHSRTDPTLKD